MAVNFDVKQKVSFICVEDRMLGAYSLTMDEPLRAESDGMGCFFLYTSWSNGLPLGRYTANLINQLAGEIVVQ